MRSLIAALRTLTLPGGVTTGRRIVLDGINGEIRVYDANNKLRVRLGTGGEIEVLSGDGDEILSGSMQATVIGVSGSTKRGVLTLESPSVATTGPDLRAVLELVSESMDDGIAPYLNMVVDAVQFNGREIGLNLVGDGIQRATANDSARAAGVATDMTRTIAVQGGHWYRASLHSSYTLATGSGGIQLDRDGTIIGLLDFDVVGDHIANSFVEFEATADDSSTTLTVKNHTLSAGNLTLRAGATEPRTFSIVDLGNDTV